MTNDRIIGNTPITDAAAASAPDTPAATNAASRVAGERENAEPATFDADGEEEALDAEDSEQDDEDSQAQTVAGDAQNRGASFEGSESEHGGKTNPAQINKDDEQDVVDHMEQMERSGRIDMDAFRGERNDDDESASLGEAGMEEGDLDEHGNAPRSNADPYIPEGE